MRSLLFNSTTKNKNINFNYLYLFFWKSCQDELDLEAKRNRDEYDVDSTDWDEDDPDTEYPNFPELDEQIQRALKKFNNKVFIKLNWSSAKDAYWCLNKLSCNRLSDVYT